jgi:CRISPR-associated protein (TIGR02584 family)
MDPQRPESYPRRVLVTVSGLTPQIVTETIYALATRAVPFVPTEVHVITTEVGKTRFLENRRHFDALFAEYGLPAARCTEQDIHLIDGPDGKASDVRTPADNEHLANLIMSVVLDLTRDQECAVHASIAGGRKTMGFYLGYLMSMFGREQDRISHVLVNEELEGAPEFFYPPRAPREVTTRDGRRVVPGRDSVLLSEIPFVRHRSGFSDEELRRGGITFAQAVAFAQHSVQGVELVIDVGRRSVRAGGVAVPMEHNPMAFLLWLADCRKRGISTVHHRDTPQGFLAWYERLLDDRGSLKFEKTKQALRHGFGDDEFRYRVQTVNRAFKKALRSRARTAQYTVELVKKGSGRYALTVPPEAITIVDATTG